ncbi:MULTISPECIES: SymE family type I addiction module toxin [Lelliottia]|uniref:SymE family type I addiction module toxin n=1 Tax=Lelliottia TaxID=1330545 RepID=UPI0036F2F497
MTASPGFVPATHREFYRRAVHYALFLLGEWLALAGFTDGMPVKIRVMPDCIVITAQNIRELWAAPRD